MFQCAFTGLVFVITQEAELLYRTVQWDESLLQSAGKMAAGMLFDIRSSEDAAVCQLHLPHCETKDGKHTAVFNVTQCISKIATICFAVICLSPYLSASLNAPELLT